MTLECPRFGILTFEEEHLIRFPSGLRDHPEFTEFVIVDEKTTEPLRWLVAVADPSFALPVIHPGLVLPEFAMDEHLASTEEVFVAVTPASASFPASVDLRHPIVVQKETRRGDHLELESPHLSSRHVLHLVEPLDTKR